MLTAVVNRLGASSFEVHLVHVGAEDDGTDTTIAEALDEGPSPIVPEVKELLWGLGAFVVFFLAMRLYLVPKVKKGMDARYGKIRGDIEQGEAVRAAAEHEVIEYQEALSEVRAEASARIEAARRQLDSERADRLTEVNARIAEKRAAAAAQAEEAKAAARQSIEAAVADVAARVSELALGQRADTTTVQRVVADVMHTGVGR